MYILTGNCDERANNSYDAKSKTDENLTNRIAKFTHVISNKTVYRIP